MARTIVDIPDAQLHDVDGLCALLGISRAEAVRRALREFVQRNDNVNADGFGLWKGNGVVADDPAGLLARLRQRG